MNKEQPAIPERSSSLINRNSQIDLTEIKARKVSAMTTRSVSSSVSEFLENKINEVFLDIEYSTRFRKALIDDIESGASQHERNSELKRAEHEEREATRELVTLKRQRKLIEDDVAEAQGHDSLETAYALAMLNRDRIPRPPTKAKKNCATHTQETFRKDVGNFYEVVEYGKTKADPKILSIYCVAAHARFDSKSVKAAHIVPKKLESAEMSMLFGGEVNLSDPRNGNKVAPHFSD